MYKSVVAMTIVCRKLSKSELFGHHPDLMRMMGVHTTVMNVIKTYLNYSSSLQKQDDVIRVRQKLRMAMSQVWLVGIMVFVWLENKSYNANLDNCSLTMHLYNTA